MDNKQTIRERLLRGLQTRLIGMVVLIALVAGGLVSVTAILNSRKVMREQIITSNLAAADMAAKLSANYIEGAETNLRLFGMRPLFIRAVIDKDLTQAEMHLAQFMENDKRFDSAAIYTANGIGWASGLKGKWRNRIHNESFSLCLFVTGFCLLREAPRRKHEGKGSNIEKDSLYEIF